MAADKARSPGNQNCAQHRSFECLTRLTQLVAFVPAIPSLDPCGDREYRPTLVRNTSPKLQEENTVVEHPRVFRMFKDD